MVVGGRDGCARGKTTHGVGREGVGGDGRLLVANSRLTRVGGRELAGAAVESTRVPTTRAS